MLCNALLTRVQRPLGAGNGGGVDGLASAGDGASTAEGAEPDHNLVLVVGTNGGGEPEVVGDISNDAGAGIAVERRVSKCLEWFIFEVVVTDLQVHLEGMDLTAESCLLTFSRATLE